MPDAPVEILLVEDNQYDITLAMYAFGASQMTDRIRVVRDGVEALEFLFFTGRYADRRNGEALKVILLDLKLPLLDGLEVLRQIKSDPRTRSTPVVVMTSSKEDRDVERAYEIGANSYVVKPVDFEQFTQLAQQLVDYWLKWNQLPDSGE